MSRNTSAFTSLLLCSVVLAGCAASGPQELADCSGLAGTYPDRGKPSGESLAQLLLGRTVPRGTVVRLDASDGRLLVAAGTAHRILDTALFACTATDELRLTNDEISSIQAPPLIDQTRIVSHVLRGGRGKDLVLISSSRTTVRPYGLPVRGPLQQEPTITWRREGR